MKIFKTTEEQKIRLLFSFFNKDNGLGISFNDFIVVVKRFLLQLYNYPKNDLKEIFNDEEFFDTEIKKKLVEIRKINRTDAPRNETS